MATATSTFRVGFVGIGEQAWESRIPRALELAPEGMEIVALADLLPEVVDRWASEFAIPRAYSGKDALGDMIKNEALDAVILTVPHALHYRLAKQALLAGLHVFVEKPFTEHADEALELIELAEAKGLVLAVGYQYPDQIARMIERVRSGEFGAVRRIYAEWMRVNGIPDRPAFWNHPSGGIDPDLVSHLLSVVVSMLDEEPIAVSASGSNDRGVELYGEAFKAWDTVDVRIVCPSGAFASVRASWAANIESDNLAIDVQCSRGDVGIPLMAGETEAEKFPPTARTRNEQGSVVFTQLDDTLPTPTEDCFREQQRNWMLACRGVQPLRHGPRAALHVRLVLDAIAESIANNGREVVIAAA